MNIKLTLPIAAALAIALLVAGGGVGGSVVPNATATSCYVSRLTSFSVAAAAGVPAARRAAVWRPGC
ncbi:MAG TPA: hypothetical protein VEK05_05655 [Burkholderiales bacterium]|nr:hypothetical protein [Burkholderiales bacterium]